MQSYTVTHVASGKTFERSPVLENPHRKERTWPSHDAAAVDSFHKTLPDYNQTQLHELTSVAAELGLGQVFLKDESTRFGLPAFKVLGASWAVHRAVCQRVDVKPEDVSVAELATLVKNRSLDLQLVTCTAGNWGRAVARIAKNLSIPARVYVPSYTSEQTKALISNEGADVRVDSGKSFDDALASTQKDAEETGALLVQDVTWEGYEEAPSWAVEGYGTMMQEVDRQVAEATGGKRPSLVVGSVGGGLWAQAVVTHYRNIDAPTMVVLVEADSCAGFKESLHCGENTFVQSGDTTIMEGLNNGSTIDTAWPLLRDGTDVAVVATDHEAHQDVQCLEKQGINAGPCGAATLVALRKVCQADIKFNKADTIAVLLSTEGNRLYRVPE
ncbi:hypothetical protein LTR27_010495 [Elasticomyces elasticus]|nr:hypothetical protein LTR27_010495 [Elasticomyces elasticus]